MMNKISDNPVVLITGSAARIGADIARLLHSSGYCIIVHYLHSQEGARELCDELNQGRTNSCLSLQADLQDLDAIEELARQGIAHWGRLDALINNASSFYPISLEKIQQADWQNLMGSNARAPAFLSKACYPALKKTSGCILNISDIAASTGRSDYSLYTMAKAALENLSRSLARELAPEVRVNTIAPGFILPPNVSGAESSKSEITVDPLSYSCLNYPASTEDIAHAALFLIRKASYITGQTLHVDGGRKLIF
jgi:pteridine reductase